MNFRWRFMSTNHLGGESNPSNSNSELSLVFATETQQYEPQVGFKRNRKDSLAILTWAPHFDAYQRVLGLGVKFREVYGSPDPL